MTNIGKVGGLVCALAIAACKITIASGSSNGSDTGGGDPASSNRAASGPSCGARLKVVRSDGAKVTLSIENVSGTTIEIGSSQWSSFVDAQGESMHAEMRPGDDDWFMPFKLPAHAHRTVQVTLRGGDPGALDRVEIPNSGGDFVPDCTIQASGLAAEK